MRRCFGWSTTRIRSMVVLAGALGVSGCKTDRMPILNPIGYVAKSEYDLLVISTVIMSAIVVPVILGTLWIVWKYRASTQHTDYDPEFDHSPTLNFVTVFVPLLTIAALGTLTWIYTHRLDPYRPLGVNEKPYEIQAISLDYKWLFIYPEAGVATINELVAPAGRPVTIRVTSDPMMTSIFIPGLISQIYAMPGMETRANFLAPKTATLEGANAMYSGPGFSKQRFKTRLVNPEDFTVWINSVKSAASPPGAAPPAGAGPGTRPAAGQTSVPSTGVAGAIGGVQSAGRLDKARYGELAKRIEAHPVAYFTDVEPDLFLHSLRKYEPGFQLKPLPTAQEYQQRELASGEAQHQHNHQKGR